jgi:hypothetical protein
MGTITMTLASIVLKWQEMYSKRLGISVLKKALQASETMKQAAFNNTGTQGVIGALARSNTLKNVTQKSQALKSSIEQASTSTIVKPLQPPTVVFTILRCLVPAIVFLLLGMILGYIEGWNFVDSFYVSSITVSDFSFFFFSISLIHSVFVVDHHLIGYRRGLWRHFPEN